MFDHISKQLIGQEDLSRLTNASPTVWEVEHFLACALFKPWAKSKSGIWLGLVQKALGQKPKIYLTWCGSRSKLQMLALKGMMDCSSK